MTNQIKLRNNAYKNVIKTKYGFQITNKKTGTRVIAHRLTPVN